MRSKEELVLEPFFNIPKHWHFDELRRRIDISKPQLSYWLKKFEKKGIIKRVKHQRKMPYYVGVFENPDFQNLKRLFALKQLTESGLLNHLSKLEDAKVVVLFGSFTRYDWYKDSDIDVFVFGTDNLQDLMQYQFKLGREVQAHIAKDKRDLKRFDKMLPYIISGYFIKGSVEDLKVEISAKV